MNRKLTLSVDTLTVTSFQTDGLQTQSGNGQAFALTQIDCNPACNTRLTCSSALC